MPEHFTAAGNRDILLRLQNNIKVRLVQSDQIEAAAGVLERMLLIAPKEPLLWLEAGGHYARLGNLRAGIEAAGCPVTFHAGVKGTQPPSLVSCRPTLAAGTPADSSLTTALTGRASTSVESSRA